MGVDTSSTSEFNPWLHWAEVDLLPWTSWSLSALKKQWIGDFDSVREMTFEKVQLDRFYKWSSCLVQLHLPGRGWTNVSLLFNDWDVCRITTYLYFGQRGSPFYLRESLCRREEELSAPRISLFWKRSVSLSLLDVFVCFCVGLVFVWVGACFCFSPPEDIRLFAFHLFSYNLRIVDQPQDVLMTVRASSAHGMGKKND